MNLIEIKLISINDFSCVTDYLKISYNNSFKDACGTEMPTYFRKFCTNQLNISYLATADYSSNYTGFKLYYEGIQFESILKYLNNKPFYFLQQLM